MNACHSEWEYLSTKLTTNVDGEAGKTGPLIPTFYLEVKGYQWARAAIWMKAPSVLSPQDFDAFLVTVGTISQRNLRRG